ncbi:MAG: site-specific DNA-methyltransferase [Candidatus Marinimicrobia bacterium]|nr:site-specific DNA-methyltransferase [Candidatus Neomarinimicrobiota bacterium]
MNYKFYNEDCISGAQKHIEDNSIDLIITDPPYGIGGDKLHKHYNRNEDHVIDGYVEVAAAEYETFSEQWIHEASRILKPGGSIYIVSGYTNLFYILKALRQTQLKELNHIIWKYNFGVYTKTKYVSSHYHILYYIKPGAKHTFNTFCRHDALEKSGSGGSKNYEDREDVWAINKEYKPGQKKNKNELPKALLKKMIAYSSHPGNWVCDMFLGGFSTAKVALEMGRYATGFEISQNMFDHQIREMQKIKFRSLAEFSQRTNELRSNQGVPWTPQELFKLKNRFNTLYKKHGTKKKTIELLCEEFGRGRFGIVNALKKAGGKQ